MRVPPRKLDPEPENAIFQIGVHFLCPEPKKTSDLRIARVMHVRAASSPRKLTPGPENAIKKRQSFLAAGAIENQRPSQRACHARARLGVSPRKLDTENTIWKSSIVFCTNKKGWLAARLAGMASSRAWSTAQFGRRCNLVGGLWTRGLAVKNWTYIQT